MYSVRMCTSPAVLTRCGIFGGIHTARSGGTSQVASRVSMRITPRVAKMSWKRGWLCQAISWAGGRSRAMRRDRTRHVLVSVTAGRLGRNVLY